MNYFLDGATAAAEAERQKRIARDADRVLVKPSDIFRAINDANRASRRPLAGKWVKILRVVDTVASRGDLPWPPKASEQRQPSPDSEETAP